MPEEEVELYDYLKVISKRKWLIIAGTLVCVFTAGIVSLRLPKVYEATLNLKVGKVWDNPIEDPYVASETITSEAFLGKITNKLNLKSRREPKGAVKASVLNEDNLIRLTVKAQTPAKSVKIINAVADLIIDNHKDKYDKAMAFYRQYEKDLTSQIAKMDSTITELRTALSHLQKDARPDAVAAILLQLELGQREAQLVTLRRELRDVRVNNYSPMHSQMTNGENPTADSATPIAPPRKRIVVVAAVLGGLVSLLLAFFLEYLGKVRGGESSISRNTQKG